MSEVDIGRSCSSSYRKNGRMKVAAKRKKDAPKFSFVHASISDVDVLGKNHVTTSMNFANSVSECRNKKWGANSVSSSVTNGNRDGLAICVHNEKISVVSCKSRRDVDSQSGCSVRVARSAPDGGNKRVVRRVRQQQSDAVDAIALSTGSENLREGYSESGLEGETGMPLMENVLQDRPSLEVKQHRSRRQEEAESECKKRLERLKLLHHQKKEHLKSVEHQSTIDTPQSTISDQAAVEHQTNTGIVKELAETVEVACKTKIKSILKKYEHAGESAVSSGERIQRPSKRKVKSVRVRRHDSLIKSDSDTDMTSKSKEIVSELNIKQLLVDAEDVLDVVEAGKGVELVACGPSQKSRDDFYQSVDDYYLTLPRSRSETGLSTSSDDCEKICAPTRIRQSQTTKIFMPEPDDNSRVLEPHGMPSKLEDNFCVLEPYGFPSEPDDNSNVLEPYGMPSEPEDHSSVLEPYRLLSDPEDNSNVLEPYEPDDNSHVLEPFGMLSEPEDNSCVFATGLHLMPTDQNGNLNSDSHTLQTGYTASESSDRSCRLDPHVYQSYAAGILHSSRKSNKFICLQKRYGNLERIADIEKKTVVSNSEAGKKQYNVLDLRYKSLGSLEPTSAAETLVLSKYQLDNLWELKELFADLDEAQEDGEFFYDMGNLEELQWNPWNDWGLGSRLLSTQQLRHLYESGKNLNERSGCRRSHCSKRVHLREVAFSKLQEKYAHLDKNAQSKKDSGKMNQQQFRERQDSDGSSSVNSQALAASGGYIQMMENAAKKSKQRPMYGYHIVENQNRYEEHVRMMKKSPSCPDVARRSAGVDTGARGVVKKTDWRRQTEGHPEVRDLTTPMACGHKGAGGSGEKRSDSCEDMEMDHAVERRGNRRLSERHSDVAELVTVESDEGATGVSTIDLSCSGVRTTGSFDDGEDNNFVEIITCRRETGKHSDVCDMTAVTPGGSQGGSTTLAPPTVSSYVDGQPDVVDTHVTRSQSTNGSFCLSSSDILHSRASGRTRAWNGDSARYRPHRVACREMLATNVETGETDEVVPMARGMGWRSEVREVLGAATEPGAASELPSPSEAAQLAAEHRLEHTDKSLKLASTSEASKGASTSEASKVASTSEASKVASTSEASKVASTSEASKVASTSEASKVASTSEASKVASTSEASKVASTSEASKVASTSEASKVASTSGASKVASSSSEQKHENRNKSSKVASSSEQRHDMSKLQQETPEVMNRSDSSATTVQHSETAHKKSRRKDSKPEAGIVSSVLSLFQKQEPRGQQSQQDSVTTAIQTSGFTGCTEGSTKHGANGVMPKPCEQKTKQPVTSISDCSQTLLDVMNAGSTPINPQMTHHTRKSDLNVSDDVKIITGNLSGLAHSGLSSCAESTKKLSGKGVGRKVEKADVDEGSARFVSVGILKRSNSEQCTAAGLAETPQDLLDDDVTDKHLVGERGSLGWMDTPVTEWSQPTDAECGESEVWVNHQDVSVDGTKGGISGEIDKRPLTSTRGRINVNYEQHYQQQEQQQQQQMTQSNTITRPCTSSGVSASRNVTYMSTPPRQNSTVPKSRSCFVLGKKSTSSVKNITAQCSASVTESLGMNSELFDLVRTKFQLTNASSSCDNLCDEVRDSGAFRRQTMAAVQASSQPLYLSSPVLDELSGPLDKYGVDTGNLFRHQSEGNLVRLERWQPVGLCPSAGGSGSVLNSSNETMIVKYSNPDLSVESENRISSSVKEMTSLYEVRRTEGVSAAGTVWKKQPVSLDATISSVLQIGPGYKQDNVVVPPKRTATSTICRDLLELKRQYLSQMSAIDSEYGTDDVHPRNGRSTPDIDRLMNQQETAHTLDGSWQRGGFVPKNRPLSLQQAMDALDAEAAERAGNGPPLYRDPPKYEAVDLSPIFVPSQQHDTQVKTLCHRPGGGHQDLTTEGHTVQNEPDQLMDCHMTHPDMYVTEFARRKHRFYYGPHADMLIPPRVRRCRPQQPRVKTQNRDTHHSHGTKTSGAQQRHLVNGRHTHTCMASATKTG